MSLRELAAERLATAHQILDDLDLLDRWRRNGEPVVVGSVGLGLVVRPDIDVEIYSATAGVTEGFVIASALAELPGVQGIRYRDFRDSRERGLYWKIEYVRADQPWTIDVWLFRGDATESRARVEAILKALTDERRDTILAIKEEAHSQGIRPHGHWLYRAVLNEGVRTLEEYQRWIGDQDVWARVPWQPNG